MQIRKAGGYEWMEVEQLRGLVTVITQYVEEGWEFVQQTAGGYSNECRVLFRRRCEETVTNNSEK